MRLFKFTAGGSAVIELVEDIGFSDTGYYFDFSHQLTEDVGFSDQSAWADIYDSIEETVGFNELVSNIMDIKTFETESVGFNDNVSWFDHGKLIEETVGFDEDVEDLEVLLETIEETVGFGESIQVIAGLYVELNETIGFNDEGNYASLLEILYEIIGFSENALLDTIVENTSDIIGFSEDISIDLSGGSFNQDLTEIVGFQDISYIDGEADMGDGDGSNLIDLDGDGIPDTDDNGADLVGFSDELNVLYFENQSEDNILEFEDYGYIRDLEEREITFTWKSRTTPVETHPTGYGKVHWGEGDTLHLGADISHYSFFGGGNVLHPGLRDYGSDPENRYFFCLPLHQIISVSDPSDPDASATFVMTPALNINMTGYYSSHFWVEVFTIDENYRWSLADYIYVHNFELINFTRTMDFDRFFQIYFGFPTDFVIYDSIYESFLLSTQPPMSA